GAELPQSARSQGAVWAGEGTGGAVRPPGAEAVGLAVPDASHAAPLHRHARRARRARRRAPRLDRAGRGEGPDRPRAAARAGGRGAPAARKPQDHGEGPTDSIIDCGGVVCMNLPTRPLGTSGLEITTVGFGAWAIGGGGWAFGWGPHDDGDSLAAMRRALEPGVN